jgi:hypothetical protein
VLEYLHVRFLGGWAGRGCSAGQAAHGL